MVSTNHFRNRRIGRSGAVAVRRPCQCPTPTPPPSAPAFVNASWAITFDDGATTYQVSARSDTLNQIDNTQAQISGFCDDGTTQWFLTVLVYKTAPQFNVFVGIDRGSGTETVALFATSDYTGQDPYLSAPQNYSGGTFNVTAGQISVADGNGYGV